MQEIILLPYRDEILQQALALPPTDRAFVAAAPEESLTPATEIAEGDANAIQGEALLAELNRRSAAYRSGAFSGGLWGGKVAFDRNFLPIPLVDFWSG